MRSLALAVLAASIVAITGTAYAGPGCTGSKTPEQTAETPPPPPPTPST